MGMDVRWRRLLRRLATSCQKSRQANQARVRHGLTQRLGAMPYQIRANTQYKTGNNNDNKDRHRHGF